MYKKNGKNMTEDEKEFPSTGIEPVSPAWNTSKLTTTPLQTVELIGNTIYIID